MLVDCGLFQGFKWLRERILEGLSGHGNYIELEQCLGQSELPANTAIHLVHGEPEALEAMRDHLRRHTPYQVDMAQYRKTLQI